MSRVCPIARCCDVGLEIARKSLVDLPMKAPLSTSRLRGRAWLRADYVIVISLWSRYRNAEQIMAIWMKSFPVRSLGCGMTGGRTE
jgi:hypothetical protein